MTDPQLAAPATDASQKQKKSKKEKKEKKARLEDKDQAKDERRKDKKAKKAKRAQAEDTFTEPDSKRTKTAAQAKPAAAPSNAKVPATSHPAVTIEDATAFYEKHQISVDGDMGHRPYTEFSHAPFDADIMQACGEFERPSPIQAACWPVVHARRDVIGIAKTGSGKTFAFAIPAIQHVTNRLANEKQPSGKKDKSTAVARPMMLVLAPTRELAIQIEEQCVKACQGVTINAACVYGGVSRGAQIGALRQAAPLLLIATPGRLQDLVEDGQVDLSNVSFLVLDEADRMLDIGFERAIRQIISHATYSPRQTVMFSATWPESIRKLAHDFLAPDAVKITIGSDNLSVNHDVTQVVEVLEPFGKNRRLEAILRKYHESRTNRILIFALYKKEADRLEQMLRQRGYTVGSIHGDKPQKERLEALNAFRDGSFPLLVATDVAARGLDIPNVEYVINYTFPLTIDDYIHRIGRTGRAGKKGVAHTFFTVDDKAHSGELINVLKSANVPIPPELLKFGTTVKKKEHKEYGAFFKEIDPNVKGTKIKFD
ncbi:RNA-dependent ATPase [Tieghemiomyces parasiticus]|uniref:RNA helicase n=1 Tax=Tieghemiomyces parasiticus TaxID=78921 RepID=A0A9W8DV27_9FUNG|nr:RNA-dependent ATPase [Tieghemiomyces parasiticus]